MLSRIFRIRRNRKLTLILPLFTLSFFVISCTVKSVPNLTQNELAESSVQTDSNVNSNVEEVSAFKVQETVVGYPVESKGFPKTRYSWEDNTVVGYPTFRSTEFPVKENKLKTRYVEGHPAKPKGFPKKRYSLEDNTVRGYPSLSAVPPIKEE